MKRVAYIVRLLITAVLLLYVLQKVGLFDAASRAELFTLIGSVKIPLLLLSLFVSLRLNLSSGFKWYLLLRSRGIAVSFFRAWALYMALLMRFKSFFDAGLGGVLYPMFSRSLSGDHDLMLEEKDN